MAEQICDGLTVLELGDGSIAAAFSGMMFADNGARVLKIEPPGGDRLRQLSPSGFLVWCRGKESVVIDLRAPAGVAALADLAAEADVFIDGLGAGHAASLGVEEAELRRRNPRLVTCSITSFGSTGEYARLPGGEGVVGAKAGLFTAGTYTGRGSGAGPVFVNVPVASVGAGHMAAAGILSALAAREQTGRGQLVEATLVQGITPLDYFNTMAWQYELLRGDAGTPTLMSVILAMPPSLPCTKDGRWLNLTTMLPHQSAAVKRALEMEWMSDDPRYATAPMFPTPEDAAAYQDLYLGAWREKSLDEWLPILLADPDVPFEVAITSEEGLDHPQAIHNGQVVKVEDPVVGTIEEIGPLARFSATPSVIRASAPALDEHDALPPAPSATDAPVSGATLRHPLEMITIVEFGYFYAMPFGVAMVGSYGARVIKVEDLTGDPMRNSFPGLSEVAAAKTMEGKESIALDLRVPAGRKILDDLLARADVFVFGFRPSVAKRLALDYESVRRVNRRIVYMNAAGYGTSGPYSHRPIYASQASATAGGYGRQCGEKLRPELAAGRSLDELRSIAAELQPPVDGDSNAALGVATALSLAIYHQRRTGQGQLVETTMINSNAYTYADDYNRYEGKPPVALPDPGQYGLHALHRLYPASSGWVFASITTDTEWVSLVATPGFETLADDERFATAASRRAHDAELVTALTAAFAERSAPDWESALTPLGLAVVEVYGGSMSDFTNTDAHLLALGLVGEVEHPIFGTILRHGVPVRFSDTPGRLAPGCVLSQHTDALLEELGYTTDEVEALKADGVVLRSPLSMLEGFPA